VVQGSGRAGLSKKNSARASATLILAALPLLLSGCDDSGEAQTKGGRRGPQGPAQVGYVVVQPTTVPLSTELAGRVVAFQSSQVRPQVTGVVQKRFFTEGTIVRRGQALYQIDPSLYRAAANEAEANLQSARANAEATRVLADRYAPLAKIEAISQQDYTNAVASARQATASVAQTRAQLDTARVNLRFTTVPAPITGRIGRSLFTVGALVSSTQAEPLATIQQLDPIFVDIPQASSALLALRRSLASGGAVPTRAEVRLKLEDGSDYGATGSVEFSEVVVDQATGTVTLRARFPNPQGLLLPGMFVRAAFAQSLQTQAFLVPQAAIARDPKGAATLYVVGPNNKAVQRTVTADRTQGAFWVVTSGVRAGDKIITQGTGALRPNADIRPVPATAPQRIVPPQAKGG